MIEVRGDAQFTSSGIATTFAKRPTVNGSGIALADENYYEVYGGRAINLSASAQNANFEADNGGGAIANFDNFFIAIREAKLVNYAVNTQHVHGSQPTGWYIRMQLNSDPQFWASGAIHFDPGVVVNGTIVGQWQGNTHIPSGSRVKLSMDNNGGPPINIVVAKAWVGLSVSGTI